MSSLANYPEDADKNAQIAGVSSLPAQQPAIISNPQQIRAETLLQIASNVVMRIGRDNLMLVAAGVAFYAMTAIFPAIAAFVSIYGLFADPNAVQSQIVGYSNLLPASSMKLLTDALENFASKSNSTLNVALLVSLGIALWSAKAGVSSLMTGLNIANETKEKRSFVVQQLIALSLTLGVILFAMVSFAAVALQGCSWPRSLASAGSRRLLRPGGYLPVWALKKTGQMEMDHVGRRDRDGALAVGIWGIFLLRLAN